MMRLTRSAWISLGIAVIATARIAAGPVLDRRVTAARADLFERRRADPLQQLRRVSPARRDGADVADDLRRRAAVGQAIKQKVVSARDAAVGRRSRASASSPTTPA